MTRPGNDPTQIGRTKVATNQIKQVNSERRVPTVEVDLVYPEESTAAVTSLWPERHEQDRLKSISE